MSVVRRDIAHVLRDDRDPYRFPSEDSIHGKKPSGLDQRPEKQRGNFRLLANDKIKLIGDKRAEIELTEPASAKEKLIQLHEEMRRAYEELEQLARSSKNASVYIERQFHRPLRDEVQRLCHTLKTSMEAGKNIDKDELQNNTNERTKLERRLDQIAGMSPRLAVIVKTEKEKPGKFQKTRGGNKYPQKIGSPRTITQDKEKTSEKPQEIAEDHTETSEEYLARMEEFYAEEIAGKNQIGKKTLTPEEEKREKLTWDNQRLHAIDRRGSTGFAWHRSPAEVIKRAEKQT